MIRRRVLYLALLGVLFYTMLLYTFPGLRLLMIFLLLLPLTGLLTLLCSVRWINAGFARKRVAVIRGRRASLKLVVANSGRLPAAQVKLTVEERKGMERPGKHIHRIFGMDGREKRETVIELQAAHCGRVEYRLRGVRIYDYLGICAWTKRCRQRAELWVLPKVEELDGGHLLSVLQEGRSLTQSTEDGDACEIRSYSIGDSLHRVHWKLSARMDSLQVRENREAQVRGTVLLLTDFRTGTKEQQYREWDEYLDRAISLLTILFDANLLAEACWFDRDGLNRQEIVNREDINTAILALMSVNPKKNEAEYPKLSANPEWWYLDRDRKLYRGEQCLYE